MPLLYILVSDLPEFAFIPFTCSFIFHWLKLALDFLYPWYIVSTSASFVYHPFLSGIHCLYSLFFSWHLCSMHMMLLWSHPLLFWAVPSVSYSLASSSSNLCLSNCPCSFSPWIFCPLRRSNGCWETATYLCKWLIKQKSLTNFCRRHFSLKLHISICNKEVLRSRDYTLEHISLHIYACVYMQWMCAYKYNAYISYVFAHLWNKSTVEVKVFNSVEHSVSCSIQVHETVSECIFRVWHTCAIEYTRSFMCVFYSGFTAKFLRKFLEESPEGFFAWNKCSEVSQGICCMRRWSLF